MTNAERQFAIEQLELFELPGPYTEEEIEKSHNLLEGMVQKGLNHKEAYKHMRDLVISLDAARFPE